MLFLVRLLSPEIYGQFALAQAIQIFLAVLSVKTIAPFALQARDPMAFDWDLQFTAGAVLNTFVFMLTLSIAAAFYFFPWSDGKTVGAVLAFMALIFPLEIVGTHYFTWLQAHHEWQRMRLLLLSGSVFGSIVAIISALFGGGVFALAVGNLCFTLPLVIGYLIRRPYPTRFEPHRLPLYQEGRAFGTNRIASASLQTGSGLIENSMLSGIFGFGVLGVYTRSIGLAQITSGRIGPVVTQTLFPVLTRAEPSSERFRRFAGILFQGVLWTSLPAAVFLSLEADRLVRFLYGEKWLDVIPLMAAAAVLLALRGLHLTMNQIMLANFQQKACLRLDIVAAFTMMAVIFSTAFLGPQFYLVALGAHAGFVLLGTAVVASRGEAIAVGDAIGSVASCIAAVVVAGACIFALPGIAVANPTLSIVLSLAAHGIVFGGVYTLVLRLTAPRKLASLIEVVPLPRLLESLVYFLLGLRRRVG